MLLYLDNSVLNRPFDDQRQPRIWLETRSFSLVLTMIESGEATLIQSPVHDLENSRNPFPLRPKWIEKWLHRPHRTSRFRTASRNLRWRWSKAASNPLMRSTSPAPKPLARPIS